MQATFQNVYRVPFRAQFEYNLHPKEWIGYKVSSKIHTYFFNVSIEKRLQNLSFEPTYNKTCRKNSQ